MADFTPSIKKVGAERAGAGRKAHPAAAMQRGKRLMKEKRFDEALEAFEACLEADPNSAQAHAAAGRIKYRQQRLEEALAHFQEAIRISPTSPAAYVRAARTQSRLGNLDKAKVLLEDAIKANPRTSIAYAGLGEVHMRQAEFEPAVKRLNQALRLNPRLVQARQRLATAYSRMEKLPEALEQLNAALRIEPNNDSLLASRGRLLLTTGDHAGARKAFDEAIELNPEAGAGTRLGLADALINLGQLEEAEKALSSTSQRDQFAARVHKLWGDLYYAQGEHKQSVESYRAASLIGSQDELDLDAPDLLDVSDEDVEWETMATNMKSSVTTAVEERRASASAQPSKKAGKKTATRTSRS